MHWRADGNKNRSVGEVMTAVVAVVVALAVGDNKNRSGGGSDGSVVLAAVGGSDDSSNCSSGSVGTRKEMLWKWQLLQQRRHVQVTTRT